MWTSNNALVPDPDKEDILASLPLDWPFLRLGLRMCGWGDNQIKYYLLGTPIIWYFSTISLVLAMGIAFWYTARMQRSYKDWAPGKSTQSRLSLSYARWVVPWDESENRS
jgi:dolichyl-phosphate-mannose-protein mannosyltransferase